jgi:hypothetical protein
MTAASRKATVAAASMPAHKCGHHGHRNKAGDPCGQNVVKGTKHCRHHAGRPLEEQRARGLLNIELSKWTLDGHDGQDLDPRTEILRLIAFWKWKANLYGGLLRDAYEAAERLQRAARAEEIVLAKPEWESDPDDEDGAPIPEHPALQTARQDLQRIFAQGGVTAFVGYKHDVDRVGRVYAVDEGIRALVKLEKDAHEMLGKFCSLAVQAKIADARIKLAEQVGLMIQMVIIGVLRDLDVRTTDQRVQELIVSHMDLVATTAGPALAA